MQGNSQLQPAFGRSVNLGLCKNNGRSHLGYTLEISGANNVPHNHMRDLGALTHSNIQPYTKSK